MTLKLRAKHDLARIEARLGLYPAELKRAAVRALNRTLTTVRATGARMLRSHYPGVKVAAIKARLRFKRASAASPVAVLEFSEKRFGLYGNFGMAAIAGRKGRGFGVRFNKMPWRLETVSGEPVTPEMLARMFRNRSTRGCQPLVMSRHTKVRTSNEVLVAPGLNAAFSERQVGQALLEVGRTRFRVVLEQEAKFRLSKRS